MKWRLGLDLGETSIGWCVFGLGQDGKEVESFLDAGVRIFPNGRDPQSKVPLAVARRLARQKRRQLDRRGKRLHKAISLLEKFGLMPKAGPERDAVYRIDPYLARAKAAEGTATDQELGRALAHLAKRRGFRSSRKDLTEDEKTGGVLREGMSKLKAELNGKTLGQLLWKWQQTDGERVRFRRGSEYYPERWMYIAEFEAIKTANQKRLTEEQWNELGEGTIFFQRQLLPVERGRCSVRNDLERAPHCLPSFEHYRLWENINNLRWCDEEGNEKALVSDQRHKLFQTMLKKKELSFPNASARKPFGLELPGFVYFNLASDVRPKLQGCPIEVEFNKAKFPEWSSLSLEQKDHIVALLLDLDQVSRAEPLAKALGLRLDFQAGFERRLEQLAETWSMELETLQKLFKIVDGIGTRIGSYCPELLREIIPWMAETACGHRHVIREILGYSLLDNEWKNSAHSLPYYGEVLTKAVMFADKSVGPDGPPEKFFGRIGNPTVHLALNQVRLIVNELIKLYGKPAQIVVELTRELKMGQKAKSEFALVQKKNKARNDRARVKLEELGRRLSYTNLLKMKLWEELTENGVGSHCIFTGKPISLSELFASNSSIQIEHLLPFSRTYDDGVSNKILCYQEANTLKGNKSPFEAFGDGRHEQEGYYWERIVKRAQGLPPNKRWRLQENAMELAEDDSWLERQLRDTAYLSRQTVMYLGAICDDVWSVPGRLTAFLRREWQMHPLLGNDKEKNRDDLRHHALDAFVVGLTTRSLLQYISKASAKGKPIAKELLDRHKSKDLLPLADLRDAFAARLDQMIVSFKPDRDVNKRFFKDTAYGVVHEDQGQSHNLVAREPVEVLKSGAERAIRDPVLASVFASNTNAKEAQDALKNLGVARVRSLSSNRSVERIPSAPYKAYALDGYAWCDVWLIPEKKPRVLGRFVTYIEAIRLEKGVLSVNDLKPHPAAKKLLRLWKMDAIRLGSTPTIYRVVKFKATQNSIVFEPMNLTGEKDSYHVKKSLPSLIKQGLEKVTLNPLGREGHYVSRHRDLKLRGGSS